MRKNSQSNNPRFHSLCQDMGFDKEAKIELVKQFSSTGQESSAQLTENEMRDLLKYLEGLVAEKNQASQINSQNINASRRKVISLLCNYNPARFTKDSKPNMLEIYNWVKNEACFSPKKLNEYAQEELNQLIENLESKPEAIAPNAEATARMKSKVIALLTASQNYETQDGKPDMERIDGFLVKSGKFHKILNAHTYQELVELVSQLEIVKDKTQAQKRNKMEVVKGGEE